MYPQVREDGQEEVETVDSAGTWEHLSTLICGLPGAVDPNPEVSHIAAYHTFRVAGCEGLVFLSVQVNISH